MSSIRDAIHADIPGVVSCLSAAFEPYRAQYTEGAWLATVLSEEAMARRLEVMRVAVALDEEGSVVGTLGFRALAAGEGHLRGMAVRPAWQGRDVAGRLLGWAEAELSAAGCSRVTLKTTHPLERGRRFWERQGYSPTGAVSDFHGMEVIELMKPLGGGAGARLRQGCQRS